MRGVRCEWQQGAGNSQGYVRSTHETARSGSRLELLLADCKILAKKNPRDTYSERHRHAVHVHVRRERPPLDISREERVDVVRVERRVPRVLGIL